jgi:hypothetical protein
MQTKSMSLIEQICNVGSGFIISLLVWQYIICPIWHIERGSGDGVQITLVFTVVSVVRGYLWRRIFNRGYPKVDLRTRSNMKW